VKYNLASLITEKCFAAPVQSKPLKIDESSSFMKKDIAKILIYFSELKVYSGILS